MTHFLSHPFSYVIDNFTFLHLYSLLVSVIAIFMGLIFFKTLHCKKDTKKAILEDDSDNKNGLQAKYKMAKQKILEKKLSIDRKERSEEEQKIEQDTLKTVMELLRHQRGNENLTMDDLQEQLDMYRTQL